MESLKIKISVNILSKTILIFKHISNNTILPHREEKEIFKCIIKNQAKTDILGSSP